VTNIRQLPVRESQFRLLGDPKDVVAFMLSDEMGRRLVDGKDPTRCRPAPRSPSKRCDRSFDMATGFNGIWKGCGVALSEAHRVPVPSRRLGLTF
jgi:hypothetical protein